MWTIWTTFVRYIFEPAAGRPALRETRSPSCRYGLARAKTQSSGGFMNILIINCGSSSVKLALVDTSTGERIATQHLERVSDCAEALNVSLPEFMKGHQLGAVAHRVVHGGEHFVHPTRLSGETVAALEALSHLAPLHLPSNLIGIRVAQELVPKLPHVAVFDTAFHATLPRRAQTYAIPTDLAKELGLRRYGFHGSSHEYVARLAADTMEEPVRALRIITCHLGNGCSVAAVEYGRSVETSMGMTPLEGLVMGSRSGDLDPGALLTLVRDKGIDETDRILNRASGLAGLSGVGNDLRDIEAKAAMGDDACRLAINVSSHRLRKYIGAYAAVMGGVDAIVFTGGIGENSALMRHRAAQRLEFLGARFDEDLNRDARVTEAEPVAAISTPHSRCRLLVVKTDEARAIAATVAYSLAADTESPSGIPLAVSARHVHLTQEAVETLFGQGHTLTPRKDVTQPGQFACVERVTLIGPRRSLESVGIIGPARSACQVEISRTDEFALGIDAPIRCSGDIDNTPGITLEGPAGRVTLTKGVIQSQRHIHMTPEDAAHFGVGHKEIVEVSIDSPGRDLIFGDVIVRVSPNYQLEMHVDTDEGNAADLCRGMTGVIHPTRDAVRIARRLR